MMDMRTTEPDYAVDWDKIPLEPMGNLGRLQPQRCTSVFPLVGFRYKWWERVLMGILGTTPTLAELADGERCCLRCGHWQFKDQREHKNAWGDRWPVTAADTEPYNP